MSQRGAGTSSVPGEASHPLQACADPAQHGFTLTELLVALGVMGLVMLGTLTLYMNSNILFLAGTNRADAQQSSRAALMLQEDLRMIGTSVPASQAKIITATATSIQFVADTRGASTLLSADVNVGDTAFTVNSAAGIKPGDTITLINGGTWQSLTVSSVTATTITVAGAATSAYPRGAQVGVPRTITYQWDSATGTLSRNSGDGLGLVPIAAGVQNFALSYYDGSDAATTTPANIRRIAVSMTTQSGSGPLDKALFTINSDARPRNL